MGRLLKNYVEFLVESKNVQDLLKKASEIIARDTGVSELLQRCEEGFYSSVQVVPTAGAESYIAIALNDGYPIAEVYSTTEPLRALLAHVFLNTAQINRKLIFSELQEHSLLKYSVFAGDRKPSLKEVADRFNYNYADFSSDALAFYTSTPISKRY